jgi:hypothetical protein
MHSGAASARTAVSGACSSAWCLGHEEFNSHFWQNNIACSGFAFHSLSSLPPYMLAAFTLTPPSFSLPCFLQSPYHASQLVAISITLSPGCQPPARLFGG